MELSYAVLRKLLSLFVIFTVLMHFCFARESVWGLKLTQNDRQFVLLPNYMFEDSYITIHGSCTSDSKNAEIQFQWLLLQLDCMEELYKMNTKAERDMFSLFAQNPTNVSDTFEMWLNANHTASEAPLRFQFSQSKKLDCIGKQILQLEDESSAPYYIASPSSVTANGRKKTTFNITSAVKKQQTASSEVSYRVASAWSDGVYHLYIRMLPVGNTNYTANVLVEMRGQYGYLPAIEWPLLPVNGVMSVLYLMAGTAWIILWATAQRHSHKIHIVIGSVAVAGALGNTMAFIDLSVRNSDGIGVVGVMWIGKLVSVCQLSLTQLLLMVVSTGFGINRPMLGRLYVCLMVTLALLTFIANALLDVVKSESLRIKYNEPWLLTLALVAFSVVLLLVTGWITVFSINTFINLFERRHSSQAKLIIFSVFMACCITVFATNIGLGAYTLAHGLLNSCQQDWKHEWIVTAVSEVQMICLLAILMWLWRPVDENKTFAFRPVSATETVAETSSEDEMSEKILLENLQDLTEDI